MGPRTGPAEAGEAADGVGGTRGSGCAQGEPEPLTVGAALCGLQTPGRAAVLLWAQEEGTVPVALLEHPRAVSTRAEAWWPGSQKRPPQEGVVTGICHAG